MHTDRDFGLERKGGRESGEREGKKAEGKKGIVLKKMDGQWSPPKAAIYDKTDHNPVHAMAF